MSVPSVPALLDTAIPMYAAGTPHPYRDACQWVMTEITNGRTRSESKQRSSEAFLECTLLNQLVSQPDEPRRIHIQEARCSSAPWRETDNHALLNLEMIIPSIAPRAEQIGVLLRLWVDADQVRAFVEVALATGPSERLCVV
jgi:hypothetical protein